MGLINLFYKKETKQFKCLQTSEAEEKEGNLLANGYKAIITIDPCKFIEGLLDEKI